ncbi:MAG: 16S rRNA (guanine(527)-N(7))-methyltransferase RsmG [candidate division KSB1 bacterium]|nr:16S rRNA (guanine(527)-N(7))-methyltransferase RsmG [candidate division KSB1 bacterium]
MRRTGRALSGDKVLQFSLFVERLLTWNQRTNLISKRDEAHIVKHHILDSLAILDVFSLKQGGHVIDIGTGAGFPGIPLLIERPDLHMVLLDSKRMKTLFLRDVVAELGLSQVEVLNQRAEIAVQNEKYAARFDYVLSRAVSDLKSVYEWSAGFATDNACIVAIKGGDLSGELHRFQAAYPNVPVKKIPVTSGLAVKERVLIVIDSALHTGG